MLQNIVREAGAAEAGPGRSDPAISEALRTGVWTIERVHQRLVEDGLLAALLPRPGQRSCARKWTERGRLGCLPSSDLPAGGKHWTLRLLAERVVTLEIVAVERLP